MSLPTWPPELTDEQQSTLLTLSTSYALSHGFTLLPPSPTSPPSSAIPAPLSLLPTPFPRAQYALARSLQPLYNALYARIALDWAFLDAVMGGIVAVDSFQAELWQGWKRVRGGLRQKTQLGVFRSDYLLDQGDVKQVEFNTIAASFGALSQRAGEMHRYLLQTTGRYFEASPHLTADNLPKNKSLEHIAAGLADGHRAYGNTKAVVLFVVQDGERNVFDQRWLQYELESKGIRTIRRTFAELAAVELAADDTLVIDGLEVGLIYYRAAYTPTDYPSATEWATRLRLEQSAAIKCPSMALQLAGAKKVQQVLAEPGVLERFLLAPDRPDVGFGPGAGSVTQADVDRLRSTWTGLWPLDDSPLGRDAYRLAKEQPARFVLKPQREGGGNNVYRHDIPPFLAALEEDGDTVPPRRAGYILMELIEPPKDVFNLLVRGGETRARRADVVSELGVYGVMLFGEGTEVVNREAGTLLRTKGRESDEGGVAIGISSIDSPVLV
ncbi:Glutathione synthetase [Cryptotrichosporon argae]